MKNALYTSLAFIILAAAAPVTPSVAAQPAPGAQTAQPTYFTAHKSLKLTRDASGRDQNVVGCDMTAAGTLVFSPYFWSDGPMSSAGNL